jgi:hypothetical protein
MVEQKDAQGFKTGIMEEKAITELSEEDIKTLSESSKPKALEDIAKEQLTALNRIAGAVTSTATAPKAALFGSAIGQAARGGVYRTESGAADIAGKALKPDELKKFVNDMTQSFKDYGSKMMSGDKVGAEKAGLEIESKLKNAGESGIEMAKKIFNDVSKLAGSEFERFQHVGNPSAKNTMQTTQTTSQKKPQPQKVQETKSAGSAMSNKDIFDLVSKMMPDINELGKQIKGGGGETEINSMLSSIGEKLGKSGMDDERMKMITDMVVDNSKLTPEHIKTLVDATKVTEKNTTQQSQIQTQSQIQETKSVGSAMTPKDIEELSNKMSPNLNKLYEQMNEGGSEDEISMTLSKIGEQLGKSGMDDKTMKEITDMLGDNAKLTQNQIKTLTDATKVTEKNTTQQQTTQQNQTQTETQAPKLSWMKQIDAFDKVTQGTAGETQTVTNSQVSDLNNQTVTATNNNQQQQTNQSDYLIDRISQAQTQTQIVEHKFDGTITIKVDAPAGVDTAYVTKTINDMVNSPAFTDKMIKSQEVIANNYGLTGGKVGAYNNTSGMGMA